MFITPRLFHTGMVFVICVCWHVHRLGKTFATSTVLCSVVNWAVVRLLWTRSLPVLISSSTHSRGAYNDFFYMHESRAKGKWLWCWWGIVHTAHGLHFRGAAVVMRLAAWLRRRKKKNDDMLIGFTAIRYANQDIALNTGMILKEMLRYEPLARILLYSDQ